MRLTNMDQTNLEVEKTQQTASTAAQTESSTSVENNPEAELLALQEKLRKTERDRDNYRKGMLAMKKGEEPALADPDLDLDSLISKKVEERLLESERELVRKQYEEKTLAQARELRELRATLQSKNASTSIAGGAGSGSGFNAGSEAKTGFFSPEQVAELSQRWNLQNIPQEKHDEMLKRLEQEMRAAQNR